MSAQPPHGKLDWDTFLKLRKLRRRYNLASSVFTSTLGTVAGVGYLANKEIDPTQMIMGMDPIVLFGLATVSCGALGWLAGPMFGSSAFAVVKRKLMPQINEVRLCHFDFFPYQFSHTLSLSPGVVVTDWMIELVDGLLQREREFLQHIKKNRVDPSFQSFSNPVPDYYGEKIGSIQQYKQWLKDQRAYNRKSKNFL